MIFFKKCWGDFYVLIALLTESVILELESTINGLSLILRVCVAFLKKLISFPATKVSSDMFSSLPSRVNFVCEFSPIFHFFQKLC